MVAVIDVRWHADWLPSKRRGKIDKDQELGPNAGKGGMIFGEDPDPEMAAHDMSSKVGDEEATVHKQGPPRPGLVPQSGDPERPVRWIRPREEQTPDAPGADFSSWLAQDKNTAKRGVLAALFDEEVANIDDFVDGKKDEYGLEVSYKANPMMSEAFGAWGELANSGDSLLVQSAGTMLFEGSLDRYYKKFDKGPYGPRGTVDPGKLEQILAGLRKSMVKERAMWEKLADKDGKITVYRGVQLGPKKAVGMTGEVPVKDVAISSWSLFPHTAVGFGNVVLERKISPRDILASVFSQLIRSGEGEVLVYTPAKGVSATVVKNDTAG